MTVWPPRWPQYDPYVTSVWPQYGHYVTYIWPQYGHYVTYVWPQYDHYVTVWPQYGHYITLCSPGSVGSDLRARAAAGDWLATPVKVRPVDTRAASRAAPAPAPAPAPPHMETSRGQEALQTMITEDRGAGTVLKWEDEWLISRSINFFL